MRVSEILCTIVLMGLGGEAGARGVFEEGPVFFGDGGGFGSAVAGPGDLNLDGHADILVCRIGIARVYSGKDEGVLLTLAPAGAGGFGWDAAAAGDVDQDGVPDVVVGAPFEDTVAVAAGRARVFSGSTGATLFTFDGTADGDWVGMATSGRGDVDNDGFPDITIGAVGEHDRGTVRVFSGFDGSVVHLFHGTAIGDGFGDAVDSSGDLDGDGFADIVAAAPWNDDIGVSAGHVRVFSGRTGQTMYTLYGFVGDALLGENGAAQVGDVDADGFGDVAVGQGWSSRAFVFSGPTGANIHSLIGNPPTDASHDKFGLGIDGAGDVDGDGHADLLVGAFEDDDNGPQSGSAYVISGADGSVLEVIAGPTEGAQFGIDVSPLGDVNADGQPDFIVGARSTENTLGEKIGSAHVYFGTGSSTAKFGAGCAGSGGIVPTLSSPPGLWLAGGTIEFAIADGLGGATALLVFGTQEGSTPIGPCTLLVAPLLSPVAMFSLSGSGPGNGAVSVTCPVPPSASSLFVTMQAFVLDPGVASGFSGSNGLSGKVY